MTSCDEKYFDVKWCFVKMNTSTARQGLQVHDGPCKADSWLDFLAVTKRSKAKK